MQLCTIGVWDDTIPGITFDEKGVSNFCRLQQQMMDIYPKGEHGQIQWERWVAEMKKNGLGRRYDCIVGVSGGVDSSYLLHLTKEYGLRPLAVNLDNGFNSETAVQNIYKVTKALDIDLETYVINYEEIKELLRAYVKAGLPWIDCPTDLAIKGVMYKIARQEKIKYIVRGNDFRSEGKQPKEWTYGDNRQLMYVYQTFGSGKRLRTFPSLTLSNQITNGLVRSIKDIRPYYFLPYDKQAAKAFLQQRYNWKDYGGHHHENLFTKFAMAYWLPKKFGIDKRKISLSAQILSGAITRDEALEMLLQPFAAEQELLELRTYVLKKLDISENEFEKVWSGPNQSIFDLPSNYKLIFALAETFQPLLKRFFAFTPTSLTAQKVLNRQ